MVKPMREAMREAMRKVLRKISVYERKGRCAHNGRKRRTEESVPVRDARKGSPVSKAARPRFYHDQVRLSLPRSIPKLFTTLAIVLLKS